MDDEFEPHINDDDLPDNEFGLDGLPQVLEDWISNSSSASNPSLSILSNARGFPLAAETVLQTTTTPAARSSMISLGKQIVWSPTHKSCLRKNHRRQELVWRAPLQSDSDNETALSLSNISRDFKHFLSRDAPLSNPYLNRRRGHPSSRTSHRCQGYNRIEINLAADIQRSAIIFHTTPIPYEICLVCKEVVQGAGSLNCECGDNGE